MSGGRTRCGGLCCGATVSRSTRSVKRWSVAVRSVAASSQTLWRLRVPVRPDRVELLAFGVAPQVSALGGKAVKDFLLQTAFVLVRALIILVIYCIWSSASSLRYTSVTHVGTPAHVGSEIAQAWPSHTPRQPIELILLSRRVRTPENTSQRLTEPLRDTLCPFYLCKSVEQKDGPRKGAIISNSTYSRWDTQYTQPYGGRSSLALRPLPSNYKDSCQRSAC